MRREWITFLCGLTAGLSIAWFLARASGEAHAAPSIVTLSPERTVELPPPPPAPPHSVLREDDLPALRDAVRTRERLRKELADLRDMRRLMRVYEDGVAMPPTISNCVHTVGLEGCPLVAESMATQRFLAECGILDYDLPRHVYAPYDQTETLGQTRGSPTHSARR